MIIVTNGKHGILREKISSGIKYWLLARGIGLSRLAYLAGYPEDYIKRVVNCENVDIPLEFLQDVVMVLNPPSCRRLSPEDTPAILSLEECLGQLEAPPPRQSTLWDYNE